jgi:hypothetical protein
MSRLHPECPHTNAPDHSVVADAHLREEPDEEEDEDEDEDEDGGNGTEDEDDEDESDDGYSE